MSRVDGLARFLSQRAPRANGSPLHVSLTLRAVDAFGAPWREVVEETFADAESARETILALPVPDEPSVLRVGVQIGNRYAVVAHLSGDWLCDYAVDPAPVFLGVARWTWSDDDIAGAWTYERPWLDAWELCPLGSWAMDFACIAGVSYRLRQRAVLACGRALAERAGAATPTCRDVIALAEEGLDHPRAENGRYPRRSRRFIDALDNLYAGVSDADRDAVRSVHNLADVLLMRPEAWTPFGAWKTAFQNAYRPLNCARLFKGDLELADVVRGVIPASAVLEGLARQSAGEGRDTAPSEVVE